MGFNLLLNFAESLKMNLNFELNFILIMQYGSSGSLYLKTICNYYFISIIYFCFTLKATKFEDTEKESNSMEEDSTLLKYKSSMMSFKV